MSQSFRSVSRKTVVAGVLPASERTPMASTGMAPILWATSQ
jgi:hypothetical protein